MHSYAVQASDKTCQALPAGSTRETGSGATGAIQSAGWIDL